MNVSAPLSRQCEEPLLAFVRNSHRRRLETERGNRMGTSSTALFADDVARDVRQQLMDLLASGEHPQHAIEGMTRQWVAPGADVEEVPVFWLALAATAWEHGCLDENLKAKALAVIDGGKDLHRWPGTLAARRRKVLDGLKTKLLRPQPKAKRPRQSEPLEAPPSIQADAPDGRGTAVAFSVPGSGVTQVYLDRTVGRARGGGSVFAAECPLDAVSLAWRDDGVLSIAHPAGSAIHKRLNSHFFHGETIAVTYVER